MNIIISEENGATIVGVVGRLDTVTAAEFERNKWGDTFNLVVESPSMLLDAGIISSELKDYCQSIWYVMFFAYLCAN